MDARKANRTGGREPAVVAAEPSCVVVGLMLILIPLMLVAIGVFLGLYHVAAEFPVTGGSK